MTINKQDILKTLVIIWLFASTSYFVNSEWTSYKAKGISQAYQQGRTDTIGQLLDQSQKNPCQPIDVTLNERKIQVVDAACLGQTDTPASPSGDPIKNKPLSK